MAVLQSRFGIQKATLTTIHAYTDGQRLQDNSHKDLRRARAAALNIIPTTTGAAVATAKTVPQLQGLFGGISVRVPVNVGSLSDIVCLLSKKTTVSEINRTFQKAAQSPRWQGILAITKEPIVSSDIVGRRESAIVDLSFTQVVDGDLVKILAWYDNEWGYANRLLEQAVIVGKS
jgi:glyceraldehyde 3-phosphate dehydrogenase